ncbi:Auxin-responsive protein SAUR32 [Ananas comosus]|uniref:Auxin-responsive protein SAUR32 n=1 Tax=Ananas comosus TaxID=4615 RepID=A0A199VG87_ANACO|nr:Auxin-responsive protein SAUR32 [Ananas comosus]
MAKLKNVIEKLKRRVFLKSDGGVPEDVKEGHFAVHAVKDEKYQRFIVEVAHLSKSEFLKVLESAEEEFGFEQAGVLVVPCHPNELVKILGLGALKGLVVEGFEEEKGDDALEIHKRKND